MESVTSVEFGLEEVLPPVVPSVDFLTPLRQLYHSLIVDSKCAKFAELQPIADLFQHHVEREAKALFTTPTSTLGEQLIGLTLKCNNLAARAFGGTPMFQKAVLLGLRASVEAHSNQSARSLAIYIDVFLTTSRATGTLFRGLHIMETVAFLHQFVGQDMDVFERHYIVFLASRLLRDRVSYVPLELGMLGVLKSNAGHHWISKVERMINDMKISEDFMSYFNLHYPAIPHQLSVKICTSGYWPATRDLAFHVPNTLQTQFDKFVNLYKTNFSDRRLKWQVDKGSAEVQIQFNSESRSSYTFECTTIQMLILVAFNDGKRLKFRQILESTGVPQSEIAHHLLSLVHPKVAILLKKPATKELKMDHCFILNPRYSNERRVVLVPLMHPIKQESQETEEQRQIELEQRHQIDAAIVREMKVRRKVKHPLLLASVISQLKCRFLPKTPQIKKRIEALIDQEYLRRDPDDYSVYEYLA